MLPRQISWMVLTSWLQQQNLHTAPLYSTEYDVESWLGRANYNYDDKYYFSASFRRDGSSRFYKDNRWGTFWSVGANWRISKEKFMENVKWIDNLSLKASPYGQQGNDAILDALGYQDYYVWQNLYDLSYSNGGAMGGFSIFLGKQGYLLGEEWQLEHRS